MTDEKKEPCGNPDCDGCYPLPRWKVAVISVRKIQHDREIKAATPEEAIALYEQGTAWPSSYDESDLAVLEIHPPTATRITDEHRLEFHRTHVCWHNLPST